MAPGPGRSAEASTRPLPVSEYRAGRGWRQEQWLQPLDPRVTLSQEATAVSTLTDANGRPIHRLGVRLDVEPTIELAGRMLRQLECTMERLPPIGRCACRASRATCRSTSPPTEDSAY